MAQMTATQKVAALRACPKNCPTPDQCDKLAALPGLNIAALIALLEKDGPGAVTLVSDLLALFGA